MEKTVSLILPIYNVEAYLERCLKSIESQTYGNIEVLMVDDGSPDNCPAICDKWAEKDSRFKALHKQNGGLSDARNFGIDRATGDYILFVDSDDFLREDTCEVYLGLAEKNEADMVVAAENFLKYDEYVENAEKEVNAAFDFDKCYTGEEYLLISLRDAHLRTEVHRSMYSANFLKENALKFMEKIYHEDEEFTPRAFLKAKRVVLTKERLYQYDNTREGSIMHDESKKHKRGRDMDTLTRSLLAVYSKVENKELRCYLKDDICWKYLDSYINNNMYSDSECVPLKKEMLHAAYTKKRKIKAFVFNLSPKLFVKVFGNK